MKRGENEAKEEREKIRNKEKKMSVTKREKGGWRVKKDKEDKQSETKNVE